MNPKLNDRVRTMAHLYDLSETELHEAVEKYERRLPRELTLEDVEHIAAERSPHQPGALVTHSADYLREAAIIEWSRFVGVPTSVARAWLKAWQRSEEATTIGRDSLLAFGHHFRPDIFFPDGVVRGPADGKLDARALASERYNSHLQKALIYDQLRAVTEASTMGGDDNWFDYLPGGIAILAHLQAEDWVEFIEYLVNDHDQDESTPEDYPDVYLFEVQSDLLTSLMVRPRD